MNTNPDLPIPISYIAGNYFVFSVDAATFLRREHHICGVLAGTLPQAPQQNVFTGLPLELMPEEARLLVEKGVACIVDEVNFQKRGMQSLMEADRQKYLNELESQGLEAMQHQTRRKERQREEVLKKMDEKRTAKAKKAEQKKDTADTPKEGSVVSLFEASKSSSSISSPRPSTVNAIDAMGITPPVSHPPLPQQPPTEHLLPTPEVPPSYSLFAHLHSKGYFLSPGLRFGCQYLAYPGDPLRFHSHFLVVSTGWDEELDLMKVIAGGRLGTGVKKGFLIGGADKNAEKSTDAEDKIRTFSIEWAGM